MTALSQFRGHPTILAFYLADFSPICREQPYKDGSLIAVKAITRALSFLANPIAYLAAFIDSFEPSIATRIFEYFVLITFFTLVYTTPYSISKYP
jgi:hypothetical protein